MHATIKCYGKTRRQQQMKLCIEEIYFIWISYDVSLLKEKK
jgi:hypothetical protein